MKILSLCMLLLPLTAFAVSLDSWMNFETGGDSISATKLGTLNVGGMLYGDGWNAIIQEKHSSRDSSGIVDRVLGSYSRTDLDINIDAGIFSINPDLVWTVDLGDQKPELVLPLQGGIAYRNGFIRPGLGIEAQVTDQVRLFARGLYWSRNLEHQDGSDLEWTDTRISGGVTWDTPLNTSLTVAGLSNKTKADYIDYESTWNRVDATVALHPRSLQRNMYFSGDVTYSFYDGQDYLEKDLADRLTSRVRLMNMGILPSVTLNNSFESVLDFDDGTVRSACTSFESRLVWSFLKDRTVPSTVILGGRVARSSIRTELAELFSRLNIYRGFSLLLTAQARVVPTSVAGAGPERQRYIFGPGLEYQLGNTARVWGVVEQERTNLVRNENWWRLRAGLELYPGSIKI